MEFAKLVEITDARVYSEYDAITDSPHEYIEDDEWCIVYTDEIDIDEEYYENQEEYETHKKTIDPWSLDDNHRMYLFFGELIEKMTRRSYSKWLKNEFIDPFEANHIFFW